MGLFFQIRRKWTSDLRRAEQNEGGRRPGTSSIGTEIGVLEENGMARKMETGGMSAGCLGHLSSPPTFCSEIIYYSIGFCGPAGYLTLINHVSNTPHLPKLSKMASQPADNYEAQLAELVRCSPMVMLCMSC